MSILSCWICLDTSKDARCSGMRPRRIVNQARRQERRQAKDRGALLLAPILESKAQPLLAHTSVPSTLSVHEHHRHILDSPLKSQPKGWRRPAGDSSSPALHTKTSDHTQMPCTSLRSRHRSGLSALLHARSPHKTLPVRGAAFTASAPS